MLGKGVSSSERKMGCESRDCRDVITLEAPFWAVRAECASNFHEFGLGCASFGNENVRRSKQEGWLLLDESDEVAATPWLATIYLEPIVVCYFPLP